MPMTPSEKHESRLEAIARLTECVARHEQRGDLIQAAIFAELLVEAQDRLHAESAPSITVGDHDPEPL